MKINLEGVLGIVLVLLILFSVCIGAKIGRDAERTFAIQAGVAEYRIDQNGNVSFHYKEATK